MDLSCAEFAHLTDDGLGEILQFCPDIHALFLAPDSNVTAECLAMLRECRPGIRCAALTREVSRAALLHMLRQYGQVQALDLSRLDCARLTNAGLEDIADIVRVDMKLQAVFLTEQLRMRALHGLTDLQSMCPSAHYVTVGDTITLSALATVVEARQKQPRAANRVLRDTMLIARQLGFA